MRNNTPHILRTPYSVPWYGCLATPATWDSRLTGLTSAIGWAAGETLAGCAAQRSQRPLDAPQQSEASERAHCGQRGNVYVDVNVDADMDMDMGVDMDVDGFLDMTCIQ